MVGAPQDHTVDEEPWRWEAVVGIPDQSLDPFGGSALELRIVVTIPPADVPEVMRRLAA
jgi:hypothetical protein